MSRFIARFDEKAQEKLQQEHQMDELAFRMATGNKGGGLPIEGIDNRKPVTIYYIVCLKTGHVHHRSENRSELDDYLKVLGGKTLKIKSYVECPKETDTYLSEKRERLRFEFTGPHKPLNAKSPVRDGRGGGIITRKKSTIGDQKR